MQRAHRRDPLGDVLEHEQEYVRRTDAIAQQRCMQTHPAILPVSVEQPHLDQKVVSLAGGQLRHRVPAGGAVGGMGDGFEGALEQRLPAVTEQCAKGVVHLDPAPRGRCWQCHGGVLEAGPVARFALGERLADLALGRDFPDHAAVAAKPHRIDQRPARDREAACVRAVAADLELEARERLVRGEPPLNRFPPGDGGAIDQYAVQGAPQPGFMDLRPAPRAIGGDLGEAQVGVLLPVPI